ncbi:MULTISPECIES: tetratricopeptide repeat protein [Streptomyces]|uniref:Tetratricopeptide repeat protein n=1 Tax=Streptomyces chartreusis NRRL 3882 TaxID=1079985 RepID=A0A2N9BDW5_STRCX|nr:MULTISPECIES: tetratricopeptide repeat protein [Streptomyces]MYS88409.1 tetratricopeptide repeat protein [Streptomyces sp. SID5464]SOR81511.1 tetratricopeptide repeat protein [Streptomyces chartreusis NRRL 3882]
MENQQEGPERRESGPGRRVRARRVLIASVAGCAVLGGVLVLLPWGRPAEPAPPSPGALAMAAVGAGVPAALPDLAELIDEREKRVRTRPKDATSWAVLGAAYVEQGRRLADPGYYPRAEKALRTSLAVRPERNVRALAGLAALSNARRDFPAARRWGEAALKLEPRRWTTYPLLIDAYTGLGEHAAAKRTLDRLTELRSGPAVLARAAAVYRDRGWREDAAASLADAAAGARAPAERAAYLERAGQLAWERGDLEDALRHFREAVRLDPDQRAAQAGQGRVLAGLGRTTEALNAYQVALAKQPCPRYALELGELYESLGMPEAARVQYDLLRERVRGAAAGGADEELVLGQFEADHGDPRSAVRRLRAEWKRQPGTEVADALGWALHRAGRSGEALRYAVRATDGEGGGGVRSAVYAYHRGMIERELERYGAARRHLAEALRINPHFSPLHAPAARAASEALGEPPDEELPEMDEE